MSMNSYQQWLEATRKQLAAAATEAEPLMEQGRFDEAEKRVRAVNSDIYGATTLGELFTTALERAVTSPNPDRAVVQALYQRALRWRSAWPGVHTAEEAAEERRHVADVEHELTQLLNSLPPL